MDEIPAAPIPSEPSAPDAAPRAWWRGDAFFIAGLAAVTLGLAFGLARWELERRARDAYLQGEQYYSWYRDPALKRAHFDAELAAHQVTLDQYQVLMRDNDLKNAYLWYDTAVELFQPPRSAWVLKSEERLKQVQPLYGAWLKSLGTPQD